MDINDSETLTWRRRTYSGQSAVTVGLQLAASTVAFLNSSAEHSPEQRSSSGRFPVFCRLNERVRIRIKVVPFFPSL